MRLFNNCEDMMRQSVGAHDLSSHFHKSANVSNSVVVHPVTGQPVVSNSVSAERFFDRGWMLIVIAVVLQTFSFVSFSYGQDPSPPVTSDIQTREVQDPPEQIQSTESSEKQGSQDPPAVEEDPDELLRKKVSGFFSSTEKADWIRAMTLLGSRLEREKPPEWINPLLLEMLTNRALENPVRTRFILSDELITNSNTGILILTVLLRQEANWPFLEEVENSFRKWSLDKTVRDRLITEFRVATDPLQLARLFDILTVGDPREVLEVAIDRLGDSDETSVPVLMASLAKFMKLELDQAEWIAWWQKNGQQPILEGIVSRTEEMGQARELAVWTRADRYLRDDNNPDRYLAWLIESMSSEQTLGIRAAAITQSGEYAKQIGGADSSVGVEKRTRIFKPVVERLVSLLQQDVNKALRSGEFQDLAFLCLAALREFSDFRSQPELVQVLKFHINRLNPDLTNGSRRLAREALNTAMALRAPVSDEVDGAIERFIPGVDQKVDTAEIRRLVSAARTIGFSENTVEILFRVGRLNSSLGEVVLEALVYGQVPESSISQVLEYYDALISSRKESNIRSLAINGIGRLGVSDGIPLLVSMVLQGASESESERGAALTMIGSIGGPEAVTGIVQILAEMELTDALRESAQQQALGQVLSDESLALARSYVLNETGDLYSWGESALKAEGLLALLRAKAQPTDLRSRNPERFQRWLLLQSKRFEILIRDLLSHKSGVDPDADTRVNDSWTLLKQELADSLVLIGEEEVLGEHAFAASRLLQLARELDGRAVVSDALGAGVATRVVDSFSVYLEEVAPQEAGTPVKSYFSKDPWSWLLDQLEAESAGTGNPELIRALRVLAEQRSEREDILNRIDALEARSEPIEQEPAPEPVEEASEEPVRE